MGKKERSAEENVHKDHRQRLKNKFLKGGLELFDPHEVLELLLFYVLPQQDTNKIAHDLINRFGSLSYALDAPYEELVKVNGIKASGATLLKLIPEIGAYYNLDKVKRGETFNSIEKIAEYCVYKYLRESGEKLDIMLFDSEMHMLGFEKLAAGSQCSVDINIELVGKLVFGYNASGFILVHNHPSGTPYPSMADMELTRYVHSVMKPFGKMLLEHLIVAGNKYVPVVHYMNNSGEFLP